MTKEEIKNYVSSHSKTLMAAGSFKEALTIKDVVRLTEKMQEDHRDIELKLSSVLSRATDGEVTDPSADPDTIGHAMQKKILKERESAVKDYVATRVCETCEYNHLEEDEELIKQDYATY